MSRVWTASSTPFSRDSIWNGKPAPSLYLHKQLDITCWQLGLTMLRGCERMKKTSQFRASSLLKVGLWRSWERASMAWKRSSVRSRPGPPLNQQLTDTLLYSLVSFGVKTLFFVADLLDFFLSSALMESTVACTLSGISCM